MYRPVNQSLQEAKWQRRFQDLQKFYQAHGHFNDQHQENCDKSLWVWMQVQRRLKKGGQLRPNRQEQLQAIGFPWESVQKPNADHERRWDEKFAELVEFRRIHGHFNIPANEKKFAALYHWASNQRHLANVNLHPERKRRLDEIGFPWIHTIHLQAYQEHWDRMFQKLVAYRQLHGHFRISNRDTEFRDLRSWIYIQRFYHRMERLLPERRRRLDEIHFSWEGVFPRR